MVHQRISTSESVTSTSAIQPPALLLRWQSQNREKKTSKENVKVESEAVTLRSHEPRPSSFYQNKNLYALDSNKRLSDSRFIVRDIRQSLEKEKNSTFITPVSTQVIFFDIVCFQLINNGLYFQHLSVHSKQNGTNFNFLLLLSLQKA